MIFKLLLTLITSLLCFSARAQTATEGSTVTIVPSIYRFGIDTRWVYGWQPSNFYCGRGSFGNVDPAPGVVKKCEQVSINEATCVLPTQGGSGVNPDFTFGSLGGVLSWWCPSTKGPQLRILTGSYLASLSAMGCYVKSTESPSKTMAKCAPASVMLPALRSIWEPQIGRILATAPK